MNKWQIAGVKYVSTATTLIALLCCVNARANPAYDPAKPHHTPTGFQNNDAKAVNKSFADFLRWQWESHGLPKPPSQPVPAVAPNLALINGSHILVRFDPSLPTQANTPSQPTLPTFPTVTWIGHATTLVQANGLNVLTDPIFSDRASPVQLFGPQRAQPPGVALVDLPPIDVVLISHNHYDHLDRTSVAILDDHAKNSGHPTLFIVPLGLKSWFANLGITHVVELDWWQHHTVKGVEFHLTPVQHWSARGLNDRSATLWGGWAVLGADFHWYYAGDTGYSRDFADTAKHFAERQSAASGGGFDLALLPIGGYAPRWFMSMQHVNPMESLRIHQDIGAKRSLGIHWGTFALTDEPLDQPPADLAMARQALGLPESSFGVLAIGESLQLPKRPPSISHVKQSQRDNSR
ncbi:MAG: MBL fold metallo-hydrolase [Burkholderiaceae bacterium]|nr:MBL fold metallo-hydrolase [Burkholderiaceae bacterium]